VMQTSSNWLTQRNDLSTPVKNNTLSAGYLFCNNKAVN